MLQEKPIKKKIAFHTLGCKLNFAETSTIARSFPPEMFERVPANAKADIYIINTCSVTDTADKKCRQAINKFIHQSPDAFIAVVGCYAQLNPGKISSIPGVDLVLGTNEKFDIGKYLLNLRKKDTAEVHSCDLSPDDIFFKSSSIGDRTRSFLKIQDGCDYCCSYCTIPKARGKSRNPTIESILEEAVKIAESGIKEIVLTGVNIGDFGKSTGDSFEELLKRLIKIKGILRYRISSIEPNLLTDNIIRLAKDSGIILPHFHIPLQSGSDKILGLMRRRYRTKTFEERVNRIKDIMPLAGIGADVIVGFPGETCDDFEDTYSFLSSLPVTYLHVFSFSERPGTPAADMSGKVTSKDKEERSKVLINLSETKHNDFCIKNEGARSEVLFEHARSDGKISGFTGNYLKVEHPWDSNLAGKVIPVKMISTLPDGRMSVEIL
ncbi:MAG TPA: tRNA (N(6)-L-threonylcarbamoyladenosine(37)-C(2))-methylthiotransferase MtaB [Bacteroidales bacterium]|nr:tRNA (N(6)-L-threonylcarbamoyladenosine(37)-C(2))-methylthiotransferase MtaB [Bacteroidales bacterium]